jgi:hypothetical protein
VNIKGFNEQFLTSSLLPICFQKAAVHFMVNVVASGGMVQHVVLDQHVLIQILTIHNVYYQHHLHPVLVALQLPIVHLRQLQIHQLLVRVVHQQVPVLLLQAHQLVQRIVSILRVL